MKRVFMVIQIRNCFCGRLLISLVSVTTQTQISHETNPLGRLFVTLSDVALVEYHKHDEERENCDIHFGFDEREGEFNIVLHRALDNINRSSGMLCWLFKDRPNEIVREVHAWPFLR